MRCAWRIKNVKGAGHLICVTDPRAAEPEPTEPVAVQIFLKPADSSD